MMALITSYLTPLVALQLLAKAMPAGKKVGTVLFRLAVGETVI